MDAFDKYIYDEITKTFAKSNISDEEYEELYQRFDNLSNEPEAKPYLFAMRYMGWGTKKQPESVIDELEELITDCDSILKGLYYDLKLFENENAADYLQLLNECEQNGYSTIFLKEWSHLNKTSEKDVHIEEPEPVKVEKVQAAPETIKYKRMSFESCGYSGLYFTSGDIDYLAARVYIEPIKTTRKVTVRSQVFDGDDAFSEVMTNEYTLSPGTSNFKTTGWGNKNYYAYYEGIYKWVIEIDGDQTYSQEFRIYGGKLKKNGIQVNDVKLFASKSSGSLESDRTNYKVSFDSSTLEYIYFKLFIDEPGDDVTVQIFIKVTCLENNAVFCDKYFLHQLNSNTISCWNGVGYTRPGMWSKGLYQYSVRIGSGTAQEGTFTVY